MRIMKALIVGTDTTNRTADLRDQLADRGFDVQHIPDLETLLNADKTEKIDAVLIHTPPSTDLNDLIAARIALPDARIICLSGNNRQQHKHTVETFCGAGSLINNATRTDRIAEEVYNQVYTPPDPKKRYKEPTGLRIAAGHVYFDTSQRLYMKLPKGHASLPDALTAMPHGVKHRQGKLSELRNLVMEALLLAAQKGEGVTVDEIDTHVYEIMPQKSGVPSALKALNDIFEYYSPRNMILKEHLVPAIQEQDGVFSLTDAFALLPMSKNTATAHNTQTTRVMPEYSK